VLDVPDLASLPRGRAFVQISGAPPVLVRTVPWWKGPYADRIRESLARYEPQRPLRPRQKVQKQQRQQRHPRPPRQPRQRSAA